MSDLTATRRVLRRFDGESDLSHSFRGGGIGAVRLVGIALRFANFALLANALDLAKFGDVTAVLALAAIVGLPVSLGFRSSVFAHVPRYQSHGAVAEIAGFRKYARSQIGRGLVGWVLLACLAGTAIWMVGQVWWWYLPAAIAVAASTVLLNLEAEIVKARDRPMVAVVAESVFPQAVLLAMVLLLWTLGSGVAAFVAAFALAPAVSLAWITSIHIVEPDAHASSDDIGNWASFRLPLIAAGLGQLVLAQAPVLILKGFASAEAAGGYSAAYRLAALATLLPTAIWSAALPRISSGIADSPSRSIKALLEFRRVFVGSLALIVAISTAVYLSAGQVLSVFGPGFSDFAPEARVMVVGLSIGSAMGPVSTLLVAFGRKFTVMGTYLSTAAAFLLATVIVQPVASQSTASLVAVAMACQNLVQAAALAYFWRRQISAAQ